MKSIGGGEACLVHLVYTQKQTILTCFIDLDQSAPFNKGGDNDINNFINISNNNLALQKNITEGDQPESVKVTFESLCNYFR